jgi:hypothetical protein
MTGMEEVFFQTCFGFCNRKFQCVVREIKAVKEEGFAKPVKSFKAVVTIATS